MVQGFGASIVFVTIAGAIVCWAVAEWWRARVPRWSRLWWTAGALFMLIHSIAAFGLFYQWRHDVALVATARQTAAMTGIASGAGLYVNYALLAVWLLDAGWWWTAPASYRSRARAIEWGIHGFLFFMFVNGAVVFADGWMRLLGIAAVAVAGVAWWIRPYRPDFRAA